MGKYLHVWLEREMERGESVHTHEKVQQQHATHNNILIINDDDHHTAFVCTPFFSLIIMYILNYLILNTW